MRKISIMLLLITQIASAQGLFESAGEENSKLAYNLNGYVKGAYFAGEHLQKNNTLVSQGLFGETALKLGVKKIGFGEAYTDIRFRSGYQYGHKTTVLEVREAYVRYFVGKFDFNIGKQIVVWGRADGFNPTDMLSLQDMMVQSADEDDRRFGNWMLRTNFKHGILNFEGIWIPVYDSWNMPFDLLSDMFPVAIQLMQKPDFSIENSSLALKANLLGERIDGSVSYFGGYNPKPSMNVALNPLLQMSFMPIAYRTYILGADFQTTVGDFGLRGEFAYTRPFDDYKKNVYLLNPELQWVIGTDRTFGNFLVNLQYMGKWVEDFSELSLLTVTFNPMEYILDKQNRMFLAQQYEFSHGFSTRLSQKMLNETLEASVFAMYNISTEEYMLRPKLDYMITDAMNLLVGIEYYAGPSNTLFNMMDKVLNKGFVELKISF